MDKKYSQYYFDLNPPKSWKHKTNGDSIKFNTNALFPEISLEQGPKKINKILVIDGKVRHFTDEEQFQYDCIIDHINKQELNVTFERIVECVDALLCAGRSLRAIKNDYCTAKKICK